MLVQPSPCKVTPALFSTVAEFGAPTVNSELVVASVLQGLQCRGLLFTVN